ncbi:hypothetical protein DFH09DRAFT_1312116 [Mycena vulgaris]|nr:hypothetical protein DFH09DRAFT_1312116 [Mycena vulgaris]
MDMLRSLVTPLFNGSSVVDGMKLVILGGTVETARHVSSSAWNHFVNSFFLTAHFSEEDHPYDWLMLWLSRRPEWQRSRELETTTRAAHAAQVQGWEGDPDLEEEEEGGLGESLSLLAFVPLRPLASFLVSLLCHSPPPLPVLGLLGRHILAAIPFLHSSLPPRPPHPRVAPVPSALFTSFHFSSRSRRHPTPIPLCVRSIAAPGRTSLHPMSSQGDATSSRGETSATHFTSSKEVSESTKVLVLQHLTQRATSMLDARAIMAGNSWGLQILELDNVLLLRQACAMFANLAGHATVNKSILELNPIPQLVKLAKSDDSAVCEFALQALCGLAHQSASAADAAVVLEVLANMAEWLVVAGPNISRWACRLLGEFARWPSSQDAVLRAKPCINLVNLLQYVNMFSALGFLNFPASQSSIT